MSLTVWSEVPEPNSPDRKYKDCGYSSALMALVYGGFTRFPLGMNTVAEREALERSDTRKDETPAYLTDLDLAVKRRYGLALGSRLAGSVDAALGRVGTGIILQGNTGAFPSHLRRYNSKADHSVFVVPLGAGKSRLYDPLAPMGYAGDIVDNSVLVAFFRALSGAGGRVIKAGAYGGATSTGSGSAGAATWPTRFGAFFRAATVNCDGSNPPQPRPACDGHKAGDNVRLWPDSATLSAAMVNQYALNVVETSGKQNPSALGAWLGLGNRGLPTAADYDTLKAACVAAANPFVGRTVKELPDTLDVIGPATTDTSIVAPLGAAINAAIAEAGNQLAHVALLVFLLIMVLLGGWLMFREPAVVVEG